MTKKRPTLSKRESGELLKGVSNNSIFLCLATRGPLFHKARSWPGTIFRDALNFVFVFGRGGILEEAGIYRNWNSVGSFSYGKCERLIG
jgi:hypothetical protein